jgi:undecaprenyl-diphosphatase
MTVTQAVVHGVVQGLGEFLPISSSAHLILVPWVTGWPDPGLAFDVALHMGTLAALLAYFGRDLWRVARAGLASVVERKVGDDPERRLAWGIVVASVPAAVAGVFLEDYAETVFRSPRLVATTLIGLGLLLYAVDRARPTRKSLGELTLLDQVLIGVAQACALVPGVSRSGATITAARALAANRDAAARFSFLLSAPITFGAGLLEAPDMLRAGLDAPFVAGVLTSALVGYFAIRYLLVYVRTRSYGIFVYYRVALGLVILALLGR